MVQLQELLTGICGGELFNKHQQFGAHTIEAETLGDRT